MVRFFYPHVKPGCCSIHIRPIAKPSKFAKKFYFAREEISGTVKYWKTPNPRSSDIKTLGSNPGFIGNANNW